MKKLLAVLLALAVVGGAFAQVTTAVAASGAVTLFNQDSQAVFERDGAGYDTLTFKATDKDGKFGFSVTDEDWITNGALTIRDWNIWYKGNYTKVILGKVRNADFRLLLPEGNYGNYFGGMSRIANSEEGLLIESTTLGALTLGLYLPVTTVAMDTADVLQKSNIGAKYALEGIGTAYLMADLDLVVKTNKINFGFSYTGMENLVANIVYKGVFADGVDAVHSYGFGVTYTMDKLYLVAEFDGTNDPAGDGNEFDVEATYNITDQMAAKGSFLYDLAGEYDFYAKLSYDYGNGLGSFVKAGYGKTPELYYSLGLTYEVSF